MPAALSVREALGVLILALGSAWFSIVCAAQPATNAQLNPGSVTMNEVMCANKGGGGFSRALLDTIAAQRDKAVLDLPTNPDWLELRNNNAQPISLQGWKLEHKPNHSITLPDITLPPGGFLIIVADGKSHPGTQAAAQVVQAFAGPQAGDTAVQMLRAPFKLPTSPSNLAALKLMRADGQVVDSMGWVPQQLANVSWGFPDPDATKQAGLPQVPGRTFLEKPTPGAANSAPARRGPHVLKVTESFPNGVPPGQPIQVDIEVSANLAPVQNVKLLYRVGFAQQQELPAAVTKRPDTSAGKAVYTATIPASAFKAGDLVRWAVTAGDSLGLTSRLPELPPNATSKQLTRVAQWFGTVVGGVADPDINLNSTVAVMEWFSEQPEQSMTPQGAPGSVIFFNGQLLDGVYVNRRGVSSLSWPKPKLKIRLASGQSVRYAPDAPAVDEFGLQSHYYELGERSYMKEPLGLALLGDAGVPASRTFYLHMRLNGRFFGLFSFVESVDTDFLKRNSIPAGGPLFKSESGELSNLRWDISPKDMPNFYSLQYPRDEDTNPNIGPESKDYPGSSEWRTLASLTRSLGGGGDVPRTAFVMSSIDIPEVVNLLAAQVIINNQDRCTKNFYVYLRPDNDQWLMIPWDMDGALGQDNGLGGSPGDNYCVLACEQWNSPLYCDSEHPQDLEKVTPWGTVTVSMAAPYVGPGQAAPVTIPQGGTRRALLQAPGGITTRPPTDIQRLVVLPKQYPNPQGWQDPDRNQTGSASPLGAAGTYNHLIDAITDVNTTRAMLMRRIRTLADVYLGPSGKLVQMANSTYTSIRSLAVRDAALWKTGIDIDRGYQQIISEYAPIRSYLLTSVYGPNGSRPLIPGPQAAATPGMLNIKLVKLNAEGASAGLPEVEINNPATDAVDISGWSLKAPDFSFKFKPGTVLPGGTTLHVVPDIDTFRKANRGKPLFFTGPLDKAQSGITSNTNVQLLDGQGQTINQA